MRSHCTEARAALRRGLSASISSKTPTCKSSFQYSAYTLAAVVLLVKGDIKHFVPKRPNPLLFSPSESTEVHLIPSLPGRCCCLSVADLLAQNATDCSLQESSPSPPLHGPLAPAATMLAYLSIGPQG